MPRPKGSKVVQCECGGRVVGMPGERVACSHCEKKYTIPKTSPKKEKVAKKVVKKAPAKKAPAKKASKKK